MHMTKACHACAGKFKASFNPDKFPAVPGFEGVGKVVESETFKEGQRVVGKPWPAGTWQQYFVVKDDVLVRSIS